MNSITQDIKFKQSVINLSFRFFMKFSKRLSTDLIKGSKINEKSPIVWYNLLTKTKSY